MLKQILTLQTVQEMRSLWSNENLYSQASPSCSMLSPCLVIHLSPSPSSLIISITFNFLVFHITFLKYVTFSLIILSLSPFQPFSSYASCLILPLSIHPTLIFSFILLNTLYINSMSFAYIL